MDVLQDLVSVYDVECIVGIIEGVYIANHKFDILKSALFRSHLCLLENLGGIFKTNDPSLWDKGCKVSGNGARATPNVEYGHVWFYRIQ
jgi:hypothetical protein